MSIRRRLLVWLLSSVLVGGLVAAGVVFALAREQANALFDYQLRQLALTLRDRDYSAQQLAEVLQSGEAADFVIQVWAPNGRLLYDSHPDVTMPPPTSTGFTDVETRDGRWRVFATWHRGLTIQVAQHRIAREALALRAAGRTLLPFLLALPLMGWLIWRLVGQEMKVLQRTAEDVARRTPESLEPIESRSVPQEVAPLVEALNGLMARLGGALAQQKEFIADAAHELRTPLTALKLQLLLAERARDEDERRRAHATLRDGIARATHVVEQLLTLARADPHARTTEWKRLDLGELARSVLQGEEPAADAKRIRIQADIPGPVPVEGDANALRAMMDNLIDNAIRYAPGGVIQVRVRSGEGAAYLEVEDQGPGIPPEQRERVFDRFYRGETGAGGTGLGLAIARRIAERHGGRIHLLDPPGGRGLLARVSLPLSPA